ncbi:MAG: site-2 protease family protein, partial [Candidatus Poribacteria bacterium]|nr:site-2 protease family protein [Candidatus Poribacteria bacterium]
VNLFPLPIADGGLILFFAIEKLRGKPLSLRTQSLIQQVSFAFIALFFLFVTFYDVWDFFPSS